MKIDFLKETKNPLSSRTEIEFEIKNEKITPSRMEVIKKISALKNAEEDAVVISKMETTFGTHDIKGYVKVYDSVEIAKKIEPAYLLKRGKKEVPKEETPAEAEPAKEETAEEKKE